MSTLVLEPSDASQAASMLADAARQGLTVVPRGSGTKLEWTDGRSDIGAYLSTKRLSEPVQHFAGDLVARIPSGATLANANAVLARAGQWLPLDPSHAERATIGGVVATNDSGPRRYKWLYEDHRVEIALSDGRVAKAGGRSEERGRLRSVAPGVRIVWKSRGHHERDVRCSVGNVTNRGHPMWRQQPGWPRNCVATRHTVCGRDRSTSRGCSSGSKRPSERPSRWPYAGLLHRAALQRTCLSATPSKGCGHESSIWESGLVAKISVLPTDVGEMLSRADAAAAAQRIQYAAIGRAALGIIIVRLDGDPSGQAAVVSELRREALARRGSAVLLSASPEFRGQLGAWGPSADTAPLMRAVKAQFDPGGLLNRGRQPWESGPS
jgi:glycolate oxidase FAD binding subunit